MDRAERKGARSSVAAALALSILLPAWGPLSLPPSPLGRTPAWSERLGPGKPQAPNGRAADAANGVTAPAAAAPLRERVLASVVGIRATLTTPRLSFKGKRHVEADEIPAGGTGTGIIVDADGLILTCAHLVEEASSVRVFLSDDRETAGRVLVADRTSDLALVSVETKPLPVLDIQTQPVLRQGERVYLASRPGGAAVRFEPGQLGATGSYHLGHSQLEFFRRYIGDIEPGDSGGALVDGEGRFIGLASVGHPEGGMGYAMAREFVIVALVRLRAGKPVVWPWLGIGVETPPEPPGARVWTIAPGSPAEAAGIRAGDRIVSLDEKPVEHFLPAMMAVISRPIGSRFKLGILRAGTNPARAAERAGPGEAGWAPGPAGGSAAEGPSPQKWPEPGPAAAAAPGGGIEGGGQSADGAVPARPGEPNAAPSGGAGVPPLEMVSIISATRPMEPILPPLDLFGRLTGIRLEMAPATQAEPAGLKVQEIAANPPEGPRPYAVGSRLVAIVPGAGLVHALEEGRTDQEVRIKTVADLRAALRASIEGSWIAAVLIWSTSGRQETMLLSGETKQYPLL